MIKLMAAAVLVCSLATIAFCDTLHLINGGKINGNITGQTEKCFVMQVGEKNYMIEKNDVIYAAAKIETSKGSIESKKSYLLPYIYPDDDSFELGLYIMF